MNEIQAALAALETKGDFYSEHEIDNDYLQINVNKLGRLVYPLTNRTIQALIAIAQPAQYGLREQTILDETVRKVWEIKPAKFNILKTGWRKGFEPLLKTIKTDLGLPDETKLTADLHNMLVYETGCFFKPHQDSEKIEGMIATMVVVLPSQHAGGELVVEHNGCQYVFDSAKQKALLQIFSFYADCRHEVKQLKTGYRVALTFNLILGDYQGEMKSLMERDFDKRVNSALKHYFATRSCIPSWHQNDKNPIKFVYLLDHEYTESGLSWEHLKSMDRTRVAALLKVADEQELDAYLTLVDYHEIWDCYDENEGYYSRKRGRFYDEEDESDEENYVLNDLIDSETRIEYWLDRQGNQKSFNSHAVSASFVYSTKNGESLEPYDSEYEGFMGNYGNTMDRWYKRAALVIWQKIDAEKILFEINPLNYVNQLYQPMREGVLIEEIKEKLYPQIDQLKDVWVSLVKQIEVHEQYVDMFCFIAYIENAQQAQAIIAHFSHTLISVEFTKQWAKLSKVYGVQCVISMLSGLLEQAKLWKGLPDFFNLMNAFYQQSLDKEVMQFLFDYQLKRNIQTLAGKVLTPRARVDSFDERHQLLEGFVDIDLLLKNETIHQALVEMVIDNALLLDAVKLADLLDKYLMLFQKDQGQNQLDQLINHVVLELEKEKNLGLKAEGDWSINIENKCVCELCQQLAEFLSDKTGQEKVWSIAKAKRDHISKIIEQMHAPVSAKTVALGSPHKLILTKHKNMHQQAKKRYKQVCGALAQLRLDFKLKEAL